MKRESSWRTHRIDVPVSPALPVSVALYPAEDVAVVAYENWSLTWHPVPAGTTRVIVNGLHTDTTGER